MNLIAKDGSISVIQPPTSTSKRVITPSKIYIKQITPSRTTNHQQINSNRSNSNNRIHSNEILQIHQPISRSTSRKKQRQWENKNLFDFNQQFLHHLKTSTNLIDDDGEDIVMDGNNMNFEIKWRSNFSEMLKSENQLSLQQFITCKDILYDKEHKEELLQRRIKKEVIYYIYI